MAKGPIPDDETFDNPWSDGETPADIPGPSQRRQERNIVTANNDAPPADNDAPPVYSGPSEESRVVPTTLPMSFVPGMPNIDFSKYQIADSTLSTDQTTVTTTLPALGSDHIALELFIREQAALPPRPYIRIMGIHTEGMKEVTDFNLQLNMIRYIVNPNEKWNFVKILPLENKSSKKQEARDNSLGEWTKRFCKDTSLMKTFTIRREVMNWNTDYLEGRIRTLLASIGYRGNVSITFPVSHSQVIVHSAPKINRLFSNILSTVVDAKKYDIVKAYWPYATLGPNSADTAGTRSYAVQSEEAWWKDWNAVIRRGVLAKRVGWLSLEDQIDLAMSPMVDVERVRNWGLDR